jgi:uncharacterized protein (DUF2141 family)
MQTAIRTAIPALICGAASASAADLTVRIDNVANNGGQVMVALYDSTAGYMKQPVRKAAVAAVAGGVTVVFKDLAPGDYGFTVFHDANGNGRLDTNAMGIPVEPIGFSKDAAGVMGPPAFDAVKFAVPQAGATAVANLR